MKGFNTGDGYMGLETVRKSQIGRASCRERVYSGVTGVQTCALPI